jgi:hypothetical protein
MVATEFGCLGGSPTRIMVHPVGIRNTHAPKRGDQPSTHEALHFKLFPNFRAYVGKRATCGMTDAVGPDMNLHNLTVVAVLVASSLSLGAGCAADTGTEGADDSNLNAVAGAYQVRLRAASGEDITLGFDRTEIKVPNRPECTMVVANPLRIQVAKAGISASSAKVVLDQWIRNPNIAFTRSADDSPAPITLKRVNATALRAEVPNVVISKSCSGVTTDYTQNLRVSLLPASGAPVVLQDPVGAKDNFWTDLAKAKKDGVSATTAYTVLAKSAAGSQVSFAFKKVAQDSKTQPATCNEVVAQPLRVTVRPSKPATKVELKLVNYMRSPAVAATPAPSSPGDLKLVKQADGSFTADIAPLVVTSMCSGSAMEYFQVLSLAVDGKAEKDANGVNPNMTVDLNKAN